MIDKKMERSDREIKIVGRYPFNILITTFQDKSVTQKKSKHTRGPFSSLSGEDSPLDLKYRPEQVC